MDEQEPIDPLSPDQLEWPYRRVLYWWNAYELVDTTLQHSLELVQQDVADLSYKRTSPATAKTKYLVYLMAAEEADPVLLGQIQIRKLAEDSTEVIMERMVRHQAAVPFEAVIHAWGANMEFDREIAQAVRDREETGNRPAKPARRQPGRRHEEDDLWAWTQVNEEGREPREVYGEWCQRPGVMVRNLIDPLRQFRKIIKPSWRTKSGRKV